MKQTELTSKLVLAIIGITSMGAILVPTYAVPTIRSADIFDETIQSVDIKNGEVKNADLANNAVTSAKIADGTIQEQDIADGVIPSSGGGSITTHFVTDSIVLEIGEQQGFTVECPSGEQVTGGGYVSSPDMSTYINAPHEAASGIAVGWDVAAQNNGNQAHELTAFVMCAQPTS
jgi:hypothetical protein